MKLAVPLILRSLIQLGGGTSITLIISAFVTLKEQVAIALGTFLTFVLLTAQNLVEAKLGKKLFIPPELTPE